MTPPPGVTHSSSFLKVQVRDPDKRGAGISLDRCRASHHSGRSGRVLVADVIGHERTDRVDVVRIPCLIPEGQQFAGNLLGLNCPTWTPVNDPFAGPSECNRPTERHSGRLIDA